jgi:hypothetical protein
MTRGNLLTLQSLAWQSTGTSARPAFQERTGDPAAGTRQVTASARPPIYRVVATHIIQGAGSSTTGSKPKKKK